MGANAGLALAGFGTGFGAMGNIRAGNDQKRLNDFNAQVADMQSDDAIARGDIAADRQRTNTKRLIGAQRAAWAASGADVNSGNAVDVQSDTASMGELDALTIKYNAAREAWGYRNQAIDYRARGDLAKSEGETKALEGALTTGGSLLYQRYGFGSTYRRY